MERLVNLVRLISTSVRRRIRFGVAARFAVAVALCVALAASPAAADVSGAPSMTGMPGAGVVQKLINWGLALTMVCGLLSFLYGLSTWKLGSKMGGVRSAGEGKEYVLGGMIAAIGGGASLLIINTLFAAGRAG